MQTKQLFYLLMLPLLFFLTSCEGKFKDWSPQKIEAYIAEHFPVGTNLSEIENFFKEQKIEGIYWDKKDNELTIRVRERSRWDVLTVRSVVIVFYFNPANKMMKFEVIQHLTGP